MARFNVSRLLRTLGLAAAVTSPFLAVAAFAEGFDGRGPSAVPAWTMTDSRTPLAAGLGTAPAVTSQQSLLLRSGATGGSGQGA